MKINRYIDDDNDVIDDVVDVNEWHNKGATIQFGDLLDDGFDWGGYNYAIPFVEPRKRAWIRARLNYKIGQHYYFRNIGVNNPGQFKLYISRTINEIMGKLGILYAELSNGLELRGGESEITSTTGNVHERFKLVNSEFPQGTVKDDYDYLSNGADRESLSENGTTVKKEQSTGQLDALLKYQEQWNDLDTQVINACEKCFSSFIQLDKGV